MLVTALIIAVVSASLLIGAAWGIWGRLPDRIEGALVAGAGGALIVSVMSELIEPASESLPFLGVAAAVMAGAVAFSLLDHVVDKRLSGSGGFGLLLAVTLDGVPENLALGVALIGAEPLEVAALAGAILLSNLPEAAGSAREMRKDGRGPWAVLGLWGGTAAVLAFAALAGNLLLADAAKSNLAIIECFAAGAVLASLATEVFPKAQRMDHHQAGVAVAVGLLLAFGLGQLGG